ncbi:protein of unknown function [Vibrio tapetis subsp. tapetis]|uniref:Uncharacterized protein n=1 Tax=Vibrio tapetis subsp. tapetis TaxID=1671868 RepID=A0A2N8ZKI9_9VIBR|nr:protein of unknown function [Vibrio tapetis subsp. tapetis]
MFIIKAEILGESSYKSMYKGLGQGLRVQDHRLLSIQVYVPLERSQINQK